jgi:hypothetical protein
MLLQDFKELKTGKRELRKFGLLVGAVFAAIGLLYFARHKPNFVWFLWPGLVLIAFGLALPRLLKPVYLVWMSLALLMGYVVSNVLLTFFFFIVITPVGLFAKLAKKDFLRLKMDPHSKSYWLPRERQPERPMSDYEKQF